MGSVLVNGQKWGQLLAPVLSLYEKLQQLRIKACSIKIVAPKQGKSQILAETHLAGFYVDYL